MSYVHQPWCCLSVEDHGCPCLCTSPSAREEWEARQEDRDA